MSYHISEHLRHDTYACFANWPTDDTLGVQCDRYTAITPKISYQAYCVY